MSKYIVIDTETGGIEREASLLTTYLEILDENLNTIDSLYLETKPNDGVYKVTGTAMKINGIDLATHDAKAITYKEAATLLYQFLEKNKAEDGQLKPIGQNVKFDIIKITDNILSDKSWNQFVSYRILDTAVIAGFLIEVGKLPKDLSAGLKAMAQYFGVGIQEEFGHDARNDVALTIAVYKELIKVGSCFTTI